MNNSLHPFKDILVRILAVIGFVTLLGGGLWGTVQVVQFVPTALSSLAGVTTTLSSALMPADRITIQKPAGIVPSDEVIALSWEHTHKRHDGSYVFSYACREGFSFQSPAPDGIYQRMSCNTDFPVPSGTTITLIPLSIQSRFVDVPVTISYLSDSSIVAEDSAVLTIENALLAQDSFRETVPDRSGAQGEQEYGVFPVGDSRMILNPNGEPDLAVVILGTGVMRQDSGFTPASSISPGDEGAVQFEVANLGTKRSGEWTFNVVLPTFPRHIFHSPVQQSLAPGDKIKFTLGFDQIDTSTPEGIITINADPTGSIKEVTEENNIKQTIVSVVRQNK